MIWKSAPPSQSSNRAFTTTSTAPVNADCYCYCSLLTNYQSPSTFCNAKAHGWTHDRAARHTDVFDMGSSAGGREPFVPGLEGLMPQLPAQAADRASAVLERHRASIMFQQGVMGAGVGLSDKADGEAAIVVYVNKDAGAKPFLPDNIEGIPVTIVLTDQFIAR